MEYTHLWRIDTEVDICSTTVVKRKLQKQFQQGLCSFIEWQGNVVLSLGALLASMEWKPTVLQL